MTNRSPLKELLGDVFENSQVELLEKVERKNKLSFVVSDEELESLNQARGGIKLSDYLRSVLFKQRLPISRVTVPAINREILIQLNRISNLLNQQARALNTARSINSFSGISQHYLQQCLNQLEELDQELKQLGRELIRLNAGIKSGEESDDWQDLEER